MNSSEIPQAVGFALLDVVALTEEITAENIPAGTQGTIVEVLSGGAFEVEFTDSFGNTIYEGAVMPDQLRLLYSAQCERGTANTADISSGVR